MFNFKKLMPLVALIVCLIASPVFAAVIATDGNYNSDGDYDISIDSDHMITFNGGKYSKYEIATTNDTLTIAESGKTVIVEGVYSTSTSTKITLPDADVGLEYTILVGGGMTADTEGADLPTVIVDVQDTDFIYEINSVAGSTYAAGNSITSTGTTGDSITFICGKNLYWYAIDKVGSWSDSN